MMQKTSQIMTEMSATFIQKPTFMANNRNVLIAGSVLLFHALAIWALQTGLLMRTVEVIVPVEVLAQIVDLPKPTITPPVLKPAPPEPVPLKVSVPVPVPVPVKQAVTTPVPVTQAPPQILTLNEPAAVTPAFTAPPPQPPAPLVAPSVPVAAVATPASPPPASAAPAKIVLPSSDAEYLSNPKPPYPPMSKRLSEQGKVTVRVLISAEGAPQKAELRQTSGYERLDQSALATVMKWRYVPGKRDGVPEAMWFNVPITFQLDQ
jgi:periplasmic protein TonB